MLLLILVFLLAAAYGLLLAVYRWGWHLPSKFLVGGEVPASRKLTVIVPARDEAANIERCLRSILESDYPQSAMELLVIDDFSSDETAVLAERIMAGGKGRVLRLQDYMDADARWNAYKKKALEIAIGEARGDWIVTTDADCVVPPHWLSEISDLSQRGSVKFIAAPVTFLPERGSVLYYFQLLDFMTLQGITVASLRLGLGSMCNGANLAFEKEAFRLVGGYAGINHIASGDDMMLMAKIRKRFPDGVAYLKSRKAIVHTRAQANWADLINQRIRWSSKADQYQERRLTWILAIVYFFNCGLLTLAVAGFWNPDYWYALAWLVAGKVVVELWFLLPVATFYRQTKALWLFPLLQPLHILYVFVAGFLGKFGTYRWKGRKVK